jgi:hypothetical protein
MPDIKIIPWLSIVVQSLTVLMTVSAGAWFLVKEPIQRAITEEVSGRVSSLEAGVNEMNAALALRIARMEAKIDLEPELRSLITLRCMGQSGVNVTIDRLKREYRTRSGVDYQEPDCERLTVR